MSILFGEKFVKRITFSGCLSAKTICCRAGWSVPEPPSQHRDFQPGEPVAHKACGIQSRTSEPPPCSPRHHSVRHHPGAAAGGGVPCKQHTAQSWLLTLLSGGTPSSSTTSCTSVDSGHGACNLGGSTTGWAPAAPL